MSHIEKEKLIKADIASIEKRVRHAFNQGYDLGFKDGKEKAKPQESVLDNIRVEIKGMTPTYHNPNWSITDLVPISEVLKLIDKY